MFLHPLSFSLCRKSVGMLSPGAWGPSAVGVGVYTDDGGASKRVLLVMTNTHIHLQTRDDGLTASDVSISQLQHSVLFSSFFNRIKTRKKRMESFSTLIQMAGYNFKRLIVIPWHFSSSLLSLCLSESRRVKWGFGAIWNSDATPDDQPRLCLLIQEG